MRKYEMWFTLPESKGTPLLGHSVGKTPYEAMINFIAEKGIIPFRVFPLGFTNPGDIS